MRIGLLLPSIFMSSKYQKQIFAPHDLFLDLAQGLLRRGHHVTVFSSSDTQTEAQLTAGNDDLVYERFSYQKIADNPSNLEKKVITNLMHKKFYELDLTEKAYQMAQKNKLDLIHVYHDYFSHFFNEATGVPTVYTLHDPLPNAGTLEYWLLDHFKHQHYISISQSQRRHPTLQLNYCGNVYHGINLNKFPFQEKAADYLLFMGRLVPEKGLHSAIQVALKTNIQLEIGTHFPDHDNESDYFKKQIKPYLDDPLIGKPGMVDGENKTLLYKDAIALLFPIEWEEPFGMVMIEAMACGTPVIAYNRGSVSEIVKDGVTGFIVNSPESNLSNLSNSTNWVIKKRGVAGFIEAVQRIGDIDRVACRKHVEENFTVEKMVAGYEKVYLNISKIYKK